MTKFYVFLFACFLTSMSSFAHEGHDHGTGQVQPTKGGVIQKAGNLYVEVVGSRKEIKVYPLKEASPKSKVLKAASLSEVKIAASYKLPKQSTGSAITLAPSSDHFIGKIDAAKFHRYEVTLKIESGSMKDEISYQIEPQE